MGNSVTSEIKGKEKVVLKMTFGKELTMINVLYVPNVTPHPDEVHSTCNCKGAYVHQVPL